MRKLSNILENVQIEKRIKLISTKEDFVKYVNEQLKSKDGYNVDLATQISEDLSATFNGDFQKAINHFNQNF